MRWFLTISFAALFSFALTGCDIDKTEEGRLPSVDVDVEGDPGKMPEYDVDAAEVDIDTKEKTIEVPDVDVEMKKKKVDVPDVDVTFPDDDNEE